MSRRPSVFQEGNFGAPLDFRLAAHSNELNYERERDSAHMKAQQAALKKQQGQKIIDDVANLDHIGNSTVDVMTDNSINGIKTTAQKMLDAGAPDSEIRAYLGQSLPPVVNGHTIAQNKSNEMKKEAVEAARIYGGSADKLYLEGMKQFVPNVVEAGQDGNLRYKSIIDPDMPVIGNLTKDENLHIWHPGNDKVSVDIQKADKEKVGDSDKFDNKGNITQTGYKGELSKFAQIVKDKNGKVVGHEVVYDEVPFARGQKPIRVLPDNLQKDLLADPQRRAGIMVRWTKEKQQSEEALGHKLDPEAERLLFGNMMYEYAKENDRSSVIPNDYQKIAKPVTNIHNSFRMGGDVPTSHVYENVSERVDKTPLGTKSASGELIIGTPVNELVTEGQNQILAIANGLRFPTSKTSGKPDKELKFTQDKLLLRRRDDGTIWIVDKTVIPERVSPNDPIPDNAWIAPYEQQSANVQQSKKDYGVKSSQKAGYENQGKQPQVVNHKPTSNYVEVKEINGVKWGKTKDGKIEKVK